jgi:hypothetical protein
MIDIRVMVDNDRGKAELAACELLAGNLLLQERKCTKFQCDSPEHLEMSRET